MKFIINTFRWIAFFPALIIVFYLIALGMDWVVYTIAPFSFWTILFIVFGGLAGISFLLAAAMIAIMYILRIAPEPRAGSIIFSIFAALVGCFSIYGYWYALDIGVAKLILISILNITFFGMLAIVPSFNKSK